MRRRTWRITRGGTEFFDFLRFGKKEGRVD
jgi:hypothetical protein